RAKGIAIARGNEQQPTRRHDRTGQYRPSRILLALGKLFGDAERHLPGNVSGGRVDRGQPAPWRFLTRPVLFTDPDIKSVSARSGFVIRERCTLARLFDRAERADVLS